MKQLSVSAISEFALCPYRYFAGFRLKLAEPAENNPYQLPRRLVGKLAHLLFERYLPSAIAGREIPETVWLQLRTECLPSEWQSVFQEIEWQRLIGQLTEALEREAKFQNTMKLETVATEYPFKLPQTVATDEGPQTVVITGRIDRIDRLSGGAYVVIDYKTTSQAVRPQDRQAMATLIKPQLPIYLLALAAAGKRPVAGLEVHLKCHGSDRGGLVADEVGESFKSRVYLKLDAEQFLTEFQAQLTLLLKRLFDEVPTPAPRQAERCGLGRCPYWRVCRYDGEVLAESEPGDDE